MGSDFLSKEWLESLYIQFVFVEALSCRASGLRFFVEDPVLEVSGVFLLSKTPCVVGTILFSLKSNHHRL